MRAPMIRRSRHVLDEPIARFARSPQGRRAAAAAMAYAQSPKGRAKIDQARRQLARAAPSASRAEPRARRRRPRLPRVV